LSRLDRLKENGVLELYLAGPTNFVLLKPATMSKVVQTFDEHQIDVRTFESTIRIAIPNEQDLERLLHCLDAL
jgi:histidinol-phosphate/aromatic aminotransferase/cobyric acid decarboxylase-like protein